MLNWLKWLRIGAMIGFCAHSGELQIPHVTNSQHFTTAIVSVNKKNLVFYRIHMLMILFTGAHGWIFRWSSWVVYTVSLPYYVITILLLPVSPLLVLPEGFCRSGLLTNSERVFFLVHAARLLISLSFWSLAPKNHLMISEIKKVFCMRFSVPSFLSLCLGFEYCPLHLS